MTDQTNTTNGLQRSLLKTAVKGREVGQEERKAMSNRVRDIVRKVNEGIPFDEVEDKKNPDERDFDSKYSDDNLEDLMEQLHSDGKLDDKQYNAVKEMWEIRNTFKDIEERYDDQLTLVTDEPIFEEFVQHVKGVSTTLCAKLINEVGYCEQAQYVTNLWSYAGIQPGSGRSKGEQLNHNPDLKQLSWLIAKRMIMQAGNGNLYYSQFYEPYKDKQVHRMEQSSCRHCGKPTADHNYSKQAESHVCPDQTALRITDQTAEQIAEADNRTTFAQSLVDNELTITDEDKKEAAVEIIVGISYVDEVDRSDLMDRVTGISPATVEDALATLIDNNVVEEQQQKVNLGDFDIEDDGVNDDATPPWSQGHANNRAIRYMAKKFLKHYWGIAREIKGLDFSKEWVFTEQCDEDHTYKEKSFENPFYARKILKLRSQGVAVDPILNSEREDIEDYDVEA